MTPGYDALATFNPQLPPHHDQYHPALFAAAWAAGGPQFDTGHFKPADSDDAPANTGPESVPTVVPPPRDRHLLPTVRPTSTRTPATWTNVKERSGRLAFSRSRDCHGLVRSFFDLI
ncbi:MAG TPA: hypothetical protein VHO25_03940 [Polyangiaceae bacterium]|nr:hypothetical protein [Polyangiaceae bacterium]